MHNGYESILPWLYGFQEANESGIAHHTKVMEHLGR